MWIKIKLRIAAWIVELRVVKWAHRVEGERFARRMEEIFGQPEEFEAICSAERNGVSAKK